MMNVELEFRQNYTISNILRFSILKTVQLNGHDIEIRKSWSEGIYLTTKINDVYFYSYFQFTDPNLLNQDYKGFELDIALSRFKAEIEKTATQDITLYEKALEELKYKIKIAKEFIHAK